MKRIKLFLAVFAAITMGTAFAQAPAGSTFSNPQVVTGLPYFEDALNGNRATTCGYGNNYTTADISCTGNFMTGQEKIYAYTPTVDMPNMEIQLTNASDNFSALFVTDDSTTVGTCLGSDYGPGNNDRSVSVSLVANTTYYFIVSTWANPSCIDFDFAVLDQTCPAPSNVYTGPILAHDTVEVFWTEMGSATQWEIEYGGNGFALGTGTTMLSNTPSTVISGLSGSTIYDVYVKAICGAGDSSYSVGPLTFETGCAPISTFTEDFDTYGAWKDVPPCWTDNIYTDPSLFAGSARTATNWPNPGALLRMYNRQDADELAYISLPTFDNVGAGTHRLKFDTWSQNSDTVIVGTMSNPNDSATFTGFDTITTNTTSTSYTVNFDTYTGSDNWVAFLFLKTNTYTYSYLDNIVWEQIPSCPEPTLLTVAPDTTSATLDWTENGSATTWVVEYGLAGFTPGTGTSNVTMTKPLNITGLTSSTGYDFYVRSVCAAGDSSTWTGPMYFYTNYCTPNPTSLDGIGITNVTIDTMSNSTGQETGNYGDYSHLIAPASQSTNLPISITMSTLWYSYYMYIWVDWNKDFVFDASEQYYLGQAPASGTFTPTINIPNTTTVGDNYRMRIGGWWSNFASHTPCYTGSWACFEDYTLQVTAPPSCIAVDSLMTSNATASSIDVSWVDLNSATSWEYEYGSVGFAQGTGTSAIVSSDSITINNLASSSNFDIYVRTICAAGDSSLWTGPVTFATLCATGVAPWSETFDVNSTPNCWSQTSSSNRSWQFSDGPGPAYGAAGMTDHTGNGGYFSWVDFSSTQDSTCLYTLDVDVTALTTPYLEYFFFSNNTSDAHLNEMYLEAWDGTSWTGVDTVSENTGGWKKFEYDISSYTYGTNLVKIRWRAETGTGGSAFYHDFVLDDIAIYEAPTCFAPTALTASNITGTSLDLGWTEPGSATTWVVEYGAPGFVSGTGTVVVASSNPTSITGLTSQTDYQFCVKSVCAPGDTSLAGCGIFRTGCLAVADFNEGFENVVTPNVPECWNTIINGTVGWINTTPWSTPNNGSLHVEVYNSSDVTGAIYLVSQQLTNVGLGTHRLRFSAKVQEAANYMVIGTMSDPTDVATFTARDTAYPTANYAEYFSSFGNYSGTDSYVAIRFMHPYTFDYSYVDDVIWEVRPSCMEPTNASASVQPTTATISWTENGSATQWEIEYGAPGFALGTGTVALATTNPYTITSLNSATTYEYYLRSVCGVGDSSTVQGPYSFHTGYCVAIPTSQNGNGITNVTMDTVNNNSTGTSTYEDYSHLVAAAQRSGNLDISVTMSTGSAWTTYDMYAWIDFNDDYVFDVSEKFHIADNVSGTATQSIVIPLNAPLGNHRMRIGGARWAWFSSASADPCYNGTFACFEDYTVAVTAAPSCIVPDGLTASNINDVTVDLNWNDYNSATQWEVEFGAPGFTLGTGTTQLVTSNPATVTALTQDTDYEFYVRAVCAPGDSSAWSIPVSAKTVCSVVAAPFFDDVENHAATSSGAIANCWSQDMGTTRPNWNVDQSGSTPSSSTGPSGAHSGVKYFYLETSGGSLGDEANLYLPRIDASSMALPILRYYYHMFGSTMGNLYAEVYDGTNWITVDSIIGEQHNSASDPWLARAITLNGYGGVSSLQLRFRGVRGSSYWSDMSLDDIEIVDTYSENLAVINVETAGDVCGLGSDSVKITFTNEGTASQTNFPVGFSINDTTIATETYTGTINSGDTVTYTFNTLANFSQPGLRDFKGYTALVGDSNLANDTAMAMLGKTHNISVYPYVEDFAGGEAGWIIDNGANGSWEFGTPSSSNIDGAASDTNAFATNLAGNYNENEDGAVYSPCFDFSMLVNPYVQLSTNFRSRTGDGALVEYSIDGGMTWATLGAQSEGNNWYNYFDWTQATDVWTGGATTWAPFGPGGWQTSTVNATMLAGESSVRFRVRFFSNAFTQNEGFAFDDFAVYEAADLGNDTVLCTADTITLNPGVYSGYLWSDSTIVPVKYLDAAVLPVGIDTIGVIVSGPGGFKMYDTVVVTVEKPVINLGTDTVVCFGETVTLDAGAGFASYLWQDGSTNQTIVTDGSTSGSFDYSVLGLTANDCPALDTVNVSVNTEVLVDLGRDTIFSDSLTQGFTYTLDAGPGFASYDWSTGETTRSIVVDSNQLDTLYTVVVTNASGCPGTDSVVVDFRLAVESGIEISTISMYPNPTTDFITIEVSNFTALGDVNINVLDITGKVVMTEQLNGSGSEFKETYDVSNLATGTYFVQFEANGEVQTRQFIIK